MKSPFVPINYCPSCGHNTLEVITENGKRLSMVDANKKPYLKNIICSNCKKELLINKMSIVILPFEGEIDL